MNRTLLVPVLAAVVAIALTGCQQPDRPPTTNAVADRQAADALLEDLAPVGATLLDGLGNYSMPITSSHPEVQTWFDQALMLTYGFNHEAAERSFLKAAELDPECAMCWWGAALVLGPHVNADMSPANNAAAWERLQAAVALAPTADPRERDYIEALAARYAQPAPVDRRSLDEAYAVSMAALAAAYPDDVDAATLYAEALMNLQPWDFWEADGTAKGNTPEILRTLEAVMARAPEHAGALHLYIHAVEASDEPYLGVAAADRLRDLIPGSGHLLHMPSHIYARVGRWEDAVAVNRDAILSDDAYLAACRPPPGVYPLGYVPHNHHFLWFAATMIGDRDTALAAAEATAQRTSDPALMRAPGLEAMQDFSMTPVFAKVRFGLWEEIRDTPRPADDLPYMQLMWHYAQAIAALRTGHEAEALQHHEAVRTLAGAPVLERMLVFDRYPLALAGRVAERVVAGEVAAAGGDHAAAIEIFEEAAALEDALPYAEPPAWHQPVRQLLGAVLLEADQAAEAEAVYRAELRRNPGNGWSLFGLAQALDAQGNGREAAEVAEEFDEVWAGADQPLTASRF